ncbi:leucyl/phenylalanyl-tRNA--protein transferase [Kushneria avicenniae]|uniref:Leucyl/phenylalanyl-tRNA--protein transferase n=1 Tax=Kushneria avicenniae TaxID=402385 RepID=A0A1I1IH69_9GAMM|nr:leucyl/phenylalanyl-tRNA--protein transferase [Kushneria avicenniae]SFC35616.1 leucyl/phenylalanyl-tRNA--protein transferase [Kushneria avicenniae]
MIDWLHPENVDFPPLDNALETPNGLLAAGGSLTPDWLLAAYRRGIFPWFNEDDPILWWSPDPRMVLFPDELRVRRSLSKRLRNSGLEATFDQAFEAVITQCAAQRQAQEGTWISSEVINAYVTMHQLGHGHSVEIWEGDTLVGGLYGILMGRVFFGESMFSIRPDSSKIALVKLVEWLLDQHDLALVDCQMHTSHLASMGARDISREQFNTLLRRHIPNALQEPMVSRR